MSFSLTDITVEIDMKQAGVVILTIAVLVAGCQGKNSHSRARTTGAYNIQVAPAPGYTPSPRNAIAAVHKQPSAKSYYQLGLAYYKLRDYGRAIPYFQKATALAPRFEGALFFEGCSYEALDKPEFALATFEQLTKLPAKSDNMAEVYFHIAQCYWAMKNANNAAWAYQQDLSYLPNDPGALDGLGIISAYNGQTHQAQGYFSRALNSAGKNQKIISLEHQHLGLLAQTENDLLTAKREYLAALKANPHNLDAKEGLRTVSQLYPTLEERPTDFCYQDSDMLLEEQGSITTATYSYGNALLRKDGEYPLFDTHVSPNRTTTLNFPSPCAIIRLYQVIVRQQSRTLPPVKTIPCWSSRLTCIRKRFQKGTNRASHLSSCSSSSRS